MKRVLKLFRDGERVAYNCDFVFVPEGNRRLCCMGAGVGSGTGFARNMTSNGGGLGALSRMEKIDGVDLGDEGLCMFVNRFGVSDGMRPVLYVMDPVFSANVYKPLYGDVYVARVDGNENLLELSDSDIDTAINNIIQIKDGRCIVRMLEN